jgi:hypothetical protein
MKSPPLAGSAPLIPEPTSLRRDSTFFCGIFSPDFAGLVVAVVQIYVGLAWRLFSRPAEGIGSSNLIYFLVI